MMLVLAVRTDAERVYAAGARATSRLTRSPRRSPRRRGIASPTQLRTVMSRDGRDLLAQFRALAPRASADLAPALGATAHPLRGRAARRRGAVRSRPDARMFTPAELPVSSPPTCGAGDVMVLMAQSVPTATAAMRRLCRPDGTPAACQSTRPTASFWLDSDQAGQRRGRGDARPRTLLRRRRHQASDEVGMRRFEQRRRLPPAAGRPRASYLVAGGLRHLSLRLRRRRRRVASIFAIDAALWTSSPDAELVGRVESDPGSRCAGPRAAVLRGRRTVSPQPSLVVGVGSGGCCGSSSAVVLAIVVTSLSLRLLGIRRGLGEGPPRRRSLGWGIAGLSPRRQRLGLGRRRARRCTSSPSASRRRWRSRWPSTCWPVPGSLATGERAGLVVAPRPLRGRPAARSPCFRRYRELVRLAASRGVRPAAVEPADRAERTGDSHGRPAPPGARGCGRRLRQARPDRGDPGRPPARRRVR